MSLREVALTAEEKDRILTICAGKALLVGGQSLAVWALYYQVAPIGVLAQAVTTDVDYLGSADVATQLSAKLGYPWKHRPAGPDDHGPTTAKVYSPAEDNGIKQVDFLSGICGPDNEGICQRAVELKLPTGQTIRVLHPLDVLESRLSNLAILPEKQNEFGIAQARLAIEVVRAFMLSKLDEAASKRTLFQAIRRVRRLALDTTLATVAFDYGLDVLAAIPSERIQAPEFVSQYWPRLTATLGQKRAAYDNRRSVKAPRS